MTDFFQAARPFDPTTLRAIREAVRGNVERFEPPSEADRALLDLVETPYETVESAAERLTELEAALRERGDRRAVFLTIYVEMTHVVHDGIETGRFNDPGWMREYLVTFANYYRRAFYAFERGDVDAVPDPWRVAFGSAIAGENLLLQDAFLGVNAHINYDLALTLEEVGIDPNRSQKYADHSAIDDILARLVDAQQEALADVYAAGIDDVDAVFGRLDETLTLRSMTEGREQAWRIAVVHTDTGLPPIRSLAHWILRVTATGGAFVVLSSHLDPEVHRTLRQIETEGVPLEEILDRIHDQLVDS
ncbi:MAG: hypothetical protein ACI8U4_001919 [Natronomonas sp.]|jgi:hypothetical protein